MKLLWWMKDLKYKMRDVVDGRDGILLQWMEELEYKMKLRQQVEKQERKIKLLCWMEELEFI